jgi:hypothetical protein
VGGVLGFLLIVLAAALPPSAQASDQVPLFNAQLEFTNPNPLRWHTDEDRRDPQKGKYVLKHDLLTDKRGDASQPFIAVVYEKLPGTIRTLDEFVQMARDRTPFPIEDIAKYDDRIIYFCNDGQVALHRLVIAHFLFRGNGVQVIAGAADGVYDHVQEDIGQFLKSIRFRATGP